MTEHGRSAPSPDIRQSLLRWRERVARTIQREREGLNQEAVDMPTEHLGEQADRRSLSPAAEVAYELLGPRADLLRQIDHVLAKLDHGTYGVCESCGQVIPEARLRALPSAVRCTPCQRAWERAAEVR
jgi:DnaK suppressor protein